MVDLESCDQDDVNELVSMIQKHFEYTRSKVAGFILDDLDNQLKNIIKVFPKDYKKALLQKKSVEEINK